MQGGGVYYGGPWGSVHGETQAQGYPQKPGKGRRGRDCKARAWSTSLAGCRRCHWATGRRAWASMSAQCWRGCPAAREPSSTLPTGSSRS